LYILSKDNHFTIVCRMNRALSNANDKLTAGADLFVIASR